MRDGEHPVVVLQVRSPSEGTGTPKKVRATLRGIKVRILAAHRRLIAAISELEDSVLFFWLVSGPPDGALVVSIMVNDGAAGPGDIARGR